MSTQAADQRSPDVRAIGTCPTCDHAACPYPKRKAKASAGGCLQWTNPEARATVRWVERYPFDQLFKEPILPHSL